MAAHASIDLHAHPGGRFGFSGGRLALRIDERRMDRRLEEMRRAGPSVATFSLVPDAPSLGLGRHGLRVVRPLAEGEGYGYLLDQYAPVQARIQRGALKLITEPDQLPERGGGLQPCALLSVEGADFLDGRLERLQEAHDMGVRSVQLVHYTVNDLGDIQTEPPRHGGLTHFGREAVETLNRLGMVIDVAHATLAVTRDVVEASAHPVMLSHTMLGSRHARQITPEHARRVAERGGLVGLWGFWGRLLGYRYFVKRVRAMVDTVGVDHVGIGTDLDGFPFLHAQYRRWMRMEAALGKSGFSSEDVAKIVGGNFMRLFRTVRGHTR